MSLVSEKRDKRVLGRFISLSIMLVITFNSAGKIQNPLSASSKTVTPSISREKGETTAEYYSKNEDITKGTTYYNNNPEVKVVGVDVQTKGIEGTVKSLDVISVQDKVDSKNTGYNISYGIGIGDHTVVRDGKEMNANGIYTANIGVGYSRGDVTQRTTNATGSFTAESGVLNVDGKTRQVGSVIGGNFTLKTKEYEHEDLEDINKSRTIGFNITITPGVTEVYRNGRPTGESKGGVAYGTRINYAENDYVAKVKATIGENVSPIIDGKLSELKDVNRDVDNRVEVIKDKEIRPINADLGTEYWATDYAREKARGDFVKAGNKIDRVAEILNAAIKNDNKDIYLYYRARMDYESKRDKGELDEYGENPYLDSEKAKEFVESITGKKIDGLQIINSRDPNIKEIIGADVIAGRAYHVGNGKIVIIADNIKDLGKAMGVLSEEGSHLYYRNRYNMKDSEDYASFYGRQFEKYFNKYYGNILIMKLDKLKYTKSELGNDWENEIILKQMPLQDGTYKSDIQKYNILDTFLKGVSSLKLKNTDSKEVLNEKVVEEYKRIDKILNENEKNKKKIELFDKLFLEGNFLKYKNLDPKEEDKFLGVYQANNVDKLGIITKKDGTRIIGIIKKEDLKNQDEYTKLKTEMVREIIESEYPIFLQTKPDDKNISNTLKEKWNQYFSAINYPNLYAESEKEIMDMVYYSFDIKPQNHSYIYSVKINGDSVEELLTTNRKDVHAIEQHEIVVHPYDYVQLTLPNFKFIGVPNNKIYVMNPEKSDFKTMMDVYERGYGYVEGGYKEIKDSEGNKKYVLFPVKFNEVNTIKFEELTNKKYHGENIYNSRVLYDKSLDKGIRIFNNVDEIKEFLRKIN